VTKPKDQRLQVFTLRLHPQERQSLEAISKHVGLPIADLVRKLIAAPMAELLAEIDREKQANDEREIAELEQHLRSNYPLTEQMYARLRHFGNKLSNK
jgi:hypothetical protein